MLLGRWAKHSYRTISVVIASTFILAGCAPGKWIEVECPDAIGSVKIPRDASVSYDVYGASYESGYRVCMAALGSVGSTRPHTDSLKIAVERFRKYLPTERNALRARLPETIGRLQDNPCDRKRLESFRILRETLDINARGLRTIAAACKDTSLDIIGVIDEYRADKD